MTHPTPQPDDDAKLRRIPFSSAQERQLLALGRAMNIAAGIVLFVGVLGPLPSLGRVVLSSSNTAAALGSAAIGLAVIALQLTLGVWLLQGASLFREVALHDKDDQRFLIVALARVRHVLLLKSLVLLVLGAVFAAVGLSAARVLLGG